MKRKILIYLIGLFSAIFLFLVYATAQEEEAAVRQKSGQISEFSETSISISTDEPEDPDMEAGAPNTFTINADTAIEGELKVDADVVITYRWKKLYGNYFEKLATNIKIEESKQPGEIKNEENQSPPRIEE